MKLTLYNTPTGLKPCYDSDFEEKKKLKIGQYYTAEIRMVRNIDFIRKYFALINYAWEYLPKEQVAGFKHNKELFRKYCEVAAGYSDLFYSPSLRKWVEVPKSISFDKMDETEFSELYEGVKGIIWRIIGRYISTEEFLNTLSHF